MRGFIQIGDGIANLLADNVPSIVAPPAIDRVDTLASTAHPSSGFFVYLHDGTSIDAQPYVKDPRSGIWLPVAASATVTAGAVPHYFEVGDLRECPAFVRLTSPVGSPKTVLWRYA